MPFTLIEYAKTAETELLRGVIETYARNSPILELLPFKDIEGNAYEYSQEDALPGIAFRGVNESYAESTGLINPQVEKLKIMGGDADTDRFLVRTEKSPTSRRAIDIMQKAKAAALYFTKIFIDGDESSDARQFDGMNKRLTGNQVITAGANGADLTENMLQQMIDAVEGDPDALLMSKAMRRQLFNLYKGSSIISETQDAFGKTVKTYNDIPIRIVEYDNNGNQILDFDETQGTETEAASIYAVRFGLDEFVSGLQEAPLEAYDLGELDTKPAFRARIEWYMTIAMFHPRSAARLKGVKKASGVV